MFFGWVCVAHAVRVSPAHPLCMRKYYCVSHFQHLTSSMPSSSLHPQSPPANPPAPPTVSQTPSPDATVPPGLHKCPLRPPQRGGHPHGDPHGGRWCVLKLPLAPEAAAGARGKGPGGFVLRVGPLLKKQRNNKPPTTTERKRLDRSGASLLPELPIMEC